MDRRERKKIRLVPEGRPVGGVLEVQADAHGFIEEVAEPAQ